MSRDILYAFIVKKLTVVKLRLVTSF